MARCYDAVLFDLLTGLVDSWSLWNRVAGDDAAGYRWRAEYLRNTYATGRYRPYEVLVAEAAHNVGLPRQLAGELASRYAELEPWPEARDALRALYDAGVPLGVVTNCSEKLGRMATERVGIPFTVIVTAERAGYYKPQPQAYRLALEELGLSSDRCLFVAGSAYDLFGTAKVGLATWWHNRARLALPDKTPAPLASSPNLASLPGFVLGGDESG